MNLTINATDVTIRRFTAKYNQMTLSGCDKQTILDELTSKFTLKEILNEYDDETIEEELKHLYDSKQQQPVES